MWQRQGHNGQKLMDSMRLLLCRPEGGLNDILSEIGKCMAYCLRFNRTLIVETNSQDAEHFKDKFGDYFESASPQFILDASDFRQKFETLQVIPTILQGRVNTYCRKSLWPENTHEGTIGITFDFTKDYAEALLVHHQNGRQKKRNAIFALRHLTLQPALTEALQRRLDVMSIDYAGFHVRHTDYKTDFKSRVEALKFKIKGDVFLATDNIDVVSYFKSVFGKECVFSFSTLPKEAGMPLHYNRQATDLRQQNTDAILDLFTLTLAKDYYFFPRVGNAFQLTRSYSGFSSLAARLRARPDILKTVLPQSFHPRMPPTRSIAEWRWRYF